MVIPVIEMFVGETAEVVSLDDQSMDVKRLKSMGVREGKLIDLLHRDPVATKKVVIGIDDTRIAFHSDLAGKISVRPLKSYFEMVKKQAYYDSLTGCLNRHAFGHVVRGELEKYAQREIPLSLLLADIDHFKRINDAFGHVAGDGILKSFAALAKGVLRRSDIICRWGGEEFLILLRGTLLNEAAVMAERLREKVESHIFPPFAGSGHVTVSIGGSGLPPGRGIEQVIRTADSALYQAKKSGRNRVRLC